MPQSVARAARTSSRAARRAGRTAAITPAAAPTATMITIGTGGTANTPKPLLGGDRPRERPAEEDPEPDSGRCAEQRDEQRLPAHGRAQLAARLADRSEQAEFPGPLVHRERERVGDAHDGDQDRQGEQTVDQPEQGLDLADDGVDVLRPGLSGRRPELLADESTVAAAVASSTPSAIAISTARSPSKPADRLTSATSTRMSPAMSVSV